MARAVSPAPGSTAAGNDDCTESYAEGSQIRLSTAASAGSSFSGWTGACAGAGACDVQVDGDRQVAEESGGRRSRDAQVIAVGRSAHRLKRRGRVRLGVKVIYLPTGGAPNTRRLKLHLGRRARPPARGQERLAKRSTAHLTQPAPGDGPQP